MEYFVPLKHKKISFLSDDKWVKSNLFFHSLMKIETYCLQRTQKLNSDLILTQWT